jgi:leucyl-tRNA synthetase
MNLPTEQKRGSGEMENSRAYDHASIEKHWQSIWYRTSIYEPDLRQAAYPFYNLMMFPYPSAEGLHVGNLFAFTGADVYGRFMAMNGRDVFEPIGFDAFGIHSENYAIKRGVHPKTLTARNVKRFRETQLKRSGNRYDWRHEVNTSEPEYYQWTQWLFLQLYKANLVVRKQAAVNWCPSCKTVLADEQVLGGSCERCDTVVEQRQLEQWFFKITHYAQRLLDNLDHLDWSDRVKTAQRNWIGRSEGLRFRMPVAGHPGTVVVVFTTRPDTIFGVTYVVLAPEHELVDQLTENEHKAAVDSYRAQVRNKSELERVVGSQQKSGVFTGAYAVNPINQERVPIWIADYVMATYGTGAIMAVPAHDERDFAFAKAFGLPLRRVIVPAATDGESCSTVSELEAAYTGPGILTHSAEFSGATSSDAAPAIMAWFATNGCGERSVQYRLRDWLISRQRYWGPPIPIIYCDTCGTVPVPEDQLPVRLPDIADWMPTGTGSSPLAKIDSFVRTRCPRCGGPARRETDVSDNFLDSAWYFLRYPSTECHDRPFDPAMTERWLPVDMYIGGTEHSVLHLLYSRFITMALHDLGLISFEEPFLRFRAHGLITKDGAKMSKSHGNVVNPDEYIDRYGADTLRMYLLFLGPYDQAGDFSDQGIQGVRRFLDRLWNLVRQQASHLKANSPSLERQRTRHQTIQQVTAEIQELKYNTALVALMKYLNALQIEEQIHLEEIETLLLLLAPFAPHMAEELWARIRKPYSIHQQAWPKADPQYLVRDKVVIGVQINGRTRATLGLAPDASEKEALSAAQSLAAIQRYLRTSTIDRIVYIPGRILNIVTAGEER